MLKFSRLRHYATRLKVADSIPDEVIEFFHFTCSFQMHYIAGPDSTSIRNEYQGSSWG
jgi:hypothetical protein